MKIHRRCACGCGGITNPGMKYVWGHNTRCFSKEAKKKKSLALMGNTNGKGAKGKFVSLETRLKLSLANIKHNPDYEYCGAWKDKEYKNDLRKDYCENAECEGNYKKLDNHHINLNKKDCRPSNVMTLCDSCHRTLHNRLYYLNNKKRADYKNYLTIIRSDKIIYIHKETKRKIIIRRIDK